MRKVLIKWRDAIKRKFQRIPQYWVDSLYWLGYYLLGIMIPVACGVLFAYALQGGFSASTVTSGGQFAIYSIAVMVTTLYLIVNSSQKRLPATQSLGLLFIMGFVAAVSFFVLAVLSMNGVDIPGWLIGWPTVIILFFCLGIAFFAVLADKKRQMPEIDRRGFGEMKDSSQTNLQEKFQRKYMGGGEK